MNDLGTRLRAADPLIDDPSMSPEAIDAMRRAIVAAADRSAAAPSWFPPIMALVATAAALAIAVAGARMRETRVVRERPASSAAQPSTSSGAPAVRRQLQFATPGGTRVIWVFDPEFNP